MQLKIKIELLRVDGFYIFLKISPFLRLQNTEMSLNIITKAPFAQKAHSW